MLNNTRMQRRDIKEGEIQKRHFEKKMKLIEWSPENLNTCKKKRNLPP